MVLHTVAHGLGNGITRCLMETLGVRKDQYTRAILILISMELDKIIMEDTRKETDEDDHRFLQRIQSNPIGHPF